MSVSDKVNILLVDDQPQKLLSYEAILTPLGENLLQARSAREALEVLLKHHVAVVLVDVVMPEMDGYELASIVRGHPRFQSIPIIFVSAVSTSDMERLKGYERGAVDYVCVPVIPEILRAKVAAFVDLYRKTRELQSFNQELEQRAAERTADLEKTLKVLEDHAARLEQEIAERKRAEDAIKDANRRKDEFLATLAHELRNPLGPLTNALELMQMAPLDKHDADQCRAIMVRQVDQLRRLVDDLLDVARISRNKLVMKADPTPLSAIIECALETSQPFLEEAGHELLLDLEGESIWVNADRVRLTQVVSNLLNNAAKYTHPGGRIWLHSGSEKGHAVIRVRDSGIGITPEILPWIFDMFTQADSSLTREHGGLGIGLTLVKSIVALHGGSVEAFSAGPGHGSEFAVRLPICQQPVAPASCPLALQAGELPRFRVLVIDDASVSAYLISRILTKLGQDVTTIHDGPAALAAIDAHRPDVIISDIAMPGMDGYELARHIRGRSHGADVHLVAMTGYGQEQDRLRAQEAGFDEHLVKPVSLAHFRTLFESLAPVAKRRGSNPA